MLKYTYLDMEGEFIWKSHHAIFFYYYRKNSKKHSSTTYDGFIILEV